MTKISLAEEQGVSGQFHGNLNDFLNRSSFQFLWVIRRFTG